LLKMCPTASKRKVCALNFTACEASSLVNVSFGSWGQRVGPLTSERTAVWVPKLERTVWVGGRSPPHDRGWVGRSRGSPAWATLATAAAEIITHPPQDRRNDNHRDHGAVKQFLHDALPWGPPGPGIVGYKHGDAPAPTGSFSAWRKTNLYH
jgi:hypothetical protein